MRPSVCFRAIPLRVPPVLSFFVVVQRRAVKAPVPTAGAEGGLAVPAERVLAEGLVGILPEGGLAEAVAVVTADIAAGRAALPVIEAGERRTAFPFALPFAAVVVVEAPGTETVLAERPSLVIATRAEGTLAFFPITAHETVATGTEGTFVLPVPAEGGAGLRGLVSVTGGTGEGAWAEGPVRILPEAGLAETVAVGTAEVAAGGTVPLVIEAREGTGAPPGLLPIAAVAVMDVPGTEAVLVERPSLVIATRAEGATVFFLSLIHI